MYQQGYAILWSLPQHAFAEHKEKVGWVALKTEASIVNTRDMDSVIALQQAAYHYLCHHHLPLAAHTYRTPFQVQMLDSHPEVMVLGGRTFGNGWIVGSESLWMGLTTL